MKRAEKAFTLVELLVVISIIALLLAILMPALSKVKEQGRTIVCASNLKNYGIALQAYAGSNNDKAPYAAYWLYSSKAQDLLIGKGIEKACFWHYEGDVKPDGSLWPYLKDKNVHTCPTFRNFAMAGGPSLCPNKNAHSSRGGRAGAMPFAPGFSYSMNFWIGFNWNTYINLPSDTANETMSSQEISLKLSAVRRAGQCMAFSEENTWRINKSLGDKWNYSNAYLNDNVLWTAPRQGYYTDNIATYHKVSPAKKNDGFANVVFVDGHTAAIKGKPEDKAYLDYGKPYEGHDKVRNIW